MSTVYDLNLVEKFPRSSTFSYDFHVTLASYVLYPVKLRLQYFSLIASLPGTEIAIRFLLVTRQAS